MTTLSRKKSIHCHCDFRSQQFEIFYVNDNVESTSNTLNVFFLKKYDFEIKYRVKNLNFANDFSRRFDYEKMTLNDICLFTLQNKLQNVAIVVIQIINIDVNEMMNEKKNDNDVIFVSNETKVKFFKQLLRKKNAKKTCAKKNIYENFTKKLLQKIKKIQNINQYVCAIKTKLKHIATQIKRDIVEKKTINES